MPHVSQMSFGKGTEPDSLWAQWFALNQKRKRRRRREISQNARAESYHSDNLLSNVLILRMRNLRLRNPQVRDEQILT